MLTETHHHAGAGPEARTAATGGGAADRQQVRVPNLLRREPGLIFFTIVDRRDYDRSNRDRDYPRDDRRRDDRDRDRRDHRDDRRDAKPYDREPPRRDTDRERDRTRDRDPARDREPHRGAERINDTPSRTTPRVDEKRPSEVVHDGRQPSSQPGMFAFILSLP